MQPDGYPISVVDLSLNQVGVCSTANSAPTVLALPAFTYGAKANAALIGIALQG